MPRFVIDVAYQGTNYSGWERQASTDKTIQAEVESALQKVLRVPVGIYGAGRTDGGVHAHQMPAHFDFPEEKLHPSFFIAINAVLPASIAVTNVYRAARDTFHARFHGQWRSYEYQIVFRKTPYLHDRSWFCRKKPDFDLMQQAAEIVMQYEDFKAFAKTGATVKHYLCKMMHSYWEWHEEPGGVKILVYHVKANRFLRGMVRSLVGTMMLVGTGAMTLDQFRKVIESRDRTNAGMSVFAGGLFLHSVGYKEGELIPLSFEKGTLG